MSNSELHIRSAEKEDLPAINALFTVSRKKMKEQGIDQWQDGYPFSSDIEYDIDNQQAYVLYSEDVLVGYFAYTTGKEEVYENITEG